MSQDDGKLLVPPDRLRTVAISCWRLFDECLRILSTYSQPDDIREYTRLLNYDYGRFKVWSGNLGVRQGGHASLDSRLRDAEAMENTIFNMLKDLEDDLQKCEFWARLMDRLISDEQQLSRLYRRQGYSTPQTQGQAAIPAWMRCHPPRSFKFAQKQ